MTAVASTEPRRRTRPHWAWFLLCPVLLVAGVALGIRAGIDEVRDVSDSFHLLGDHGAGTVRLEAGDEPTVYAVWLDGRSSDGLERPDARVTVTGPGGESVTVEPSSGGRSTFSLDGESGIDLGSFRAPTDGRYAIRVAYPATAQPAAPTAGIAELHLGRSFRRILRPMGLGALAAFALMVALFVLRHADGRRRRNATSAELPSSAGPITFR